MKLFDFDDILICPTRFSDIRSRSEINVRYTDGMLPLMTAPMDTVISLDNFHYFKDQGIVPVIPRIEHPDKDWWDNDRFFSYGIEDFERIFLDNTVSSTNGKPILVLIDIANGHMKDLYNISIDAKNKYGDQMKLMVGNIANPDTYFEYVKSNSIDYIRIGIGNGNGCLTTVQTGIGYPMASLIEECRRIKLKYGKSNLSKIVADGGFKKYSDIIKALAIGADFVMLGSILNKCLESAGETRKHRDSTLGGYELINQFSQETKKMFDVDIPLFKTFRGMSTKEVQMGWGKKTLTTSEGIVKEQMVEYTVEGWVDNFQSYLKSAMSYTGKKELHQFIGGVEYNHITENAFRRFDK